MGDSMEVIRGFPESARQETPSRTQQSPQVIVDRRNKEDMMSMKIKESSGNVFTDLGFPPEKAESLRLRALLMVEIHKYIEREGLTQKEAAARMGVKQPRISEIKRGKVDLFTIDQLVNMLARVEIEVSLKMNRKAA